MSDRITYFGKTDFRNRETRFGIKERDRARHMYIIGKSGTGKTTFLENMMIQDIASGEGMAFIDPHGESSEKILNYIPEHRLKDVVYFAPSDIEYPVAFNPLECTPETKHFVVAGLMSVFKKIWKDAWSARMEHILLNTLLALAEYPGATLLGVNKMYTNKEFRKKVVDHITEPSVRDFWVEEFANYTEKFAAEATPAIQNKIGQFTGSPMIRNIIGQPKSSFNFRECMDSQKIVIINLSQGLIGEQNMALLGGLFVTNIYLSAMSRANLSERELSFAPPFYFYVDEFQNFANESFESILSQSRKYKLALTVANQYIEQMMEEVRNAIFGNVGSLISFRIGPNDAVFLENQFMPTFTMLDLQSLGFGQFYVKLLIDGRESSPFSGLGLGPVPRPEVSYKNAIIDYTRTMLARPRETIETTINEWNLDMGKKPAPIVVQRAVPAPLPVLKPSLQVDAPLKTVPLVPQTHIQKPVQIQSQSRDQKSDQSIQLEKIEKVEKKEVKDPVLTKSIRDFLVEAPEPFMGQKKVEAKQEIKPDLKKEHKSDTHPFFQKEVLKEKSEPLKEFKKEEKKDLSSLIQSLYKKEESSEKEIPKKVVEEKKEEVKDGERAQTQEPGERKTQEKEALSQKEIMRYLLEKERKSHSVHKNNLQAVEEKSEGQAERLHEILRKEVSPEDIKKILGL